ncbi:STAS domain-containing protein [Alicyclobacillus dauci]|uniref:Anti-sigma factor antagonist n=1 Tax=Alicyclobacillus dauci TaxID=1475485 RepID=A0ABY6Z3L0_9BACL|nr:STAS domain-containing protein [Alicyclobacillus dauci]WAH36791.1 STAS domain-containing protein [Alicyclobacillus dauci]
MFRVQTSRDNETIQFALTGSLDMNGVDTLEDEFSKTEFTEGDTVEIDFEDVEFIDSTGIGSIVNLIQSLEGSDIRYRLTNVSEEIQEVFTIIGLEDLVK